MVIAQKYPRYATFLHAIVNHAFKLCQKDELVAQTALMACHSHVIHHYWIPLALQDWIAAHLQQFLACTLSGAGLIRCPMDT